MWCLWNGEYGEHDIEKFYTNENSLKKNLDRMEWEYAKYPGTVVGDFTCIKVEYDWGKRTQRWTVKCNRCGEQLYVYNVNDWKRGKGRALQCKCRKEEKEKAKIDKSLQRIEKISEIQKKNVGKCFGDWKIIEFTHQNGITNVNVECTVCGKQRKNVSLSDVQTQNVKPCNHKLPLDFTSDEWIGKKNGHLTAIGRNGKDFIAKCDCGNKIIIKPTFMFTYKNRRDCGMPDCPYSTPLERASRERRNKGFSFERDIEQKLIEKGYNAIKTQDQSDFGVDVIIQEQNGNKIAVQCKQQERPAGVDAVQEVYAGGRFYDCTKFAVICEKGFSNPAIIMAKKLGVYLCDGEFNMPNDISEYAAELLPVHHTNEKNKKLYELYGVKKSLADWCIAFDTDLKWVRKQLHDGVSLSLALTTPKKEKPKFTVEDFTGTLSEICDHFGVLQPTIEYRMKQKGMTLEEAIFTPKITQGRPSTN